MSRILIASALSLVLHGGTALALGAWVRSGGFTPPRVVHVVLFGVDGDFPAQPTTPVRILRSLASAARRAAAPPSASAIPKVETPQAAPPRDPAPEVVAIEVAPSATSDVAPPTAPPVSAGNRDGSLSTATDAARGHGAGGERPRGEGFSAMVAPGSASGATGALTFAIPRYQDNRRPVYPWQARVRGEQGTVLLAVLVDARGRVSELRVERSSGSRALDDAATATVRQWTFHPGVRGREPVDSWVQVPIRFRLED